MLERLWNTAKKKPRIKSGEYLTLDNISITAIIHGGYVDSPRYEEEIMRRPGLVGILVVAVLANLLFVWYVVPLLPVSLWWLPYVGLGVGVFGLVAEIFCDLTDRLIVRKN